MTALVAVAAVGTALVAGVLFAFSTLVMQGLRAAPPRAGLVVMQGINRAAPRPLFLGLLLGTALVSAAVVVVAVVRWGDGAGPVELAAGLLYLVGVIGLTAAFHVPRNDALATVDPDAAVASQAWARYAGPWTKANHLRTLAAASAAVLLVGALAHG